MQEDLISVIVPVNNAEDSLDRCVESLTNQTYENLEIILIDNASIDDSPILCDLWPQRDFRVKVIHNSENSVAGCKNAGLDYANGEYITFVNANNFVDKEYVFTLLKNLEETHSDMSICSYTRFLENAKTTEPEEVETEEINDMDSDEETIEDDEENLTETLQDESEETIEEDNAPDENEEVEEPGDEETKENDDSDDGSNNDSDYNLDDLQETTEQKEETINAPNVKLLEKKKSRSRLVIFEGDDIFDYFFSGVEKIKTLPYGKLFRKSIFKKLRFDEDRIYEDEFIAHKIYSECKKFVRTTSGLYYYNVSKKPLKEINSFNLKDLDFYYALESRYNYFKDTKWQPQALNQMLIQIANIYCMARAGKADSNTLKFLKHKFKLYYNLQKKHKLRDKCFKHFPTLFYNIKCVVTKNK